MSWRRVFSILTAAVMGSTALVMAQSSGSPGGGTSSGTSGGPLGGVGGAPSSTGTPGGVGGSLGTGILGTSPGMLGTGSGMIGPTPGSGLGAGSFENPNGTATFDRRFNPLTGQPCGASSAAIGSALRSGGTASSYSGRTVGQNGAGGLGPQADIKGGLGPQVNIMTPEPGQRMPGPSGLSESETTGTAPSTATAPPSATNSTSAGPTTSGAPRNTGSGNTPTGSFGSSSYPTLGAGVGIPGSTTGTSQSSAGSGVTSGLGTEPTLGGIGC